MKICVTTISQPSDEHASIPFLWKDWGNIYYCFKLDQSLRLGHDDIDDSDINYCWARRLPGGTFVTLTVE